MVTFYRPTSIITQIGSGTYNSTYYLLTKSPDPPSKDQRGRSPKDPKYKILHICKVDLKIQVPDSQIVTSITTIRTLSTRLLGPLDPSVRCRFQQSPELFIIRAVYCRQQGK